jgi:PAS domain S-box-containing protein
MTEMPSALVPGSQAGQQDAQTTLLEQLARRVSREQDLQSRLDRLAEAVAAIPGIHGALVAAWDGSHPTAYGITQLSFSVGSLPFTTLADLDKSIPQDGSWSETVSDRLQLVGAAMSSTSSVRAMRLVDSGTLLGIIVVGQASPADSTSALDCFESALEHFRWLIRETLSLERARYFQHLREMERDDLGRVRNIEPEHIAQELKRVFRADAVTILLWEQEKLYLSATTDEELAKKVVTYDPGEGLTGYIFSTDTPFRLANAFDRNEVRIQSQREYNREPAVNPETLSKNETPVRFLGVPMRHGDRVRGVVRMLRRESAAPFSPTEQDALQHFADLLGFAMHSAWRLLLADSIMDADTEAICITRYEPGEGYATPIMVWADRGTERLFNLQLEQIKGMDARDFYAEGEYQKIREVLDAAIANQQQETERIKTKVRRFNSPGDELRFVDISYRLLTSPFVQPKTHYTLAVIRDITEAQRKSDQHVRLVTLLDKQGLAYFRADKNGLTLESSAAESRLTGYDLKRLKGMPRESLYCDPSDRSKLLKLVHERDGQLVHTTQHLKRIDGTPFFAEGMIHLMKDDDQPAGYEGLYEDVTDRLRLQGFLDTDSEKPLTKRELYEKLEEANRFQLLFMTSLSHQLRSPLGALLGQLKNFKEGITDAARFSQRLHYAIGQVKVCSLLVANLTYMDKILRREAFDLRPINISKIAIETGLDFKHIAREGKIRIEVDGGSLDRHLPGVKGHPELIRQVFVNLIDNAVKYSVPNSTIRLCGREKPGVKYLEISNRGLRIPRTERKRIFERGVRMQAAEDLIPDGSGLGLWLVKKILDVHGGTILCTEILRGNHECTCFQIDFQTKSGAGRRVVN